MRPPPHSSLPRIPFTKEAFEKMQHDAARLQTEREETLERLKTAREQGDLSENGAYRYAKMELGNISRQLRTLHHLLRFGYIAATTTQNERVAFGSKITLISPTKEITYTIVGEHEADPSQRKLSTVSPIGKAAFGKTVGAVVKVSTPSGEIQYTIKKIA
jgi:transcription elongation factor GreA